MPGNCKESETSWCPRCLEAGIHVQLISHLYRKEELINGELPQDSYDWLQCWDCGYIMHDWRTIEDICLELKREEIIL
jgi:hypothetical protein